MSRARQLTALGVAVAVILATAIFAGPWRALPAWAQDEDDAPHPAHIHSGTCDDLGDIVAPLSDVTEQTAGESFGAETAILVKESETTVELTLGEILAAPHAINIHESAEQIQNYIACGDIGGRVVDGELVIGLRELNGSGHFGVADLDDVEGGTDVTINLADAGAGAEDEAAQGAPDAAATTAPADAAAATEEPAAATEAPAADEPAPAAAEVPVDIRDFAFGPNVVEVAVGDTVTWTNQDEVPHTATAENRDVMQSGAIAPGASFSQVFDTAGEFPYFCEFHPNMTGTVVVQ
jgi:plastocyanin